MAVCLVSRIHRNLDSLEIGTKEDKLDESSPVRD